MPGAPDWLPPLIRFEDYHGDWARYVEAVYAHFEGDFVNDRPAFAGLKVVLKQHPYAQGKEATFWHVTSEGFSAQSRVPDPRRCERIRWLRAIIEHAADDAVKVWKNRRGSQTRICLWLEEQEFLVVLTERKGYLILCTAYPVTENHRKRKLRAEYEAYRKANAAP